MSTPPDPVPADEWPPPGCQTADGPGTHPKALRVEDCLPLTRKHVD